MLDKKTYKRISPSIGEKSNFKKKKKGPKIKKDSAIPALPPSFNWANVGFRIFLPGS